MLRVRKRMRGTSKIMERKKKKSLTVKSDENKIVNTL